MKPFVVLIFPCCQTTPGLADNVRKRGKISIIQDSASLPLICKLLAYFNCLDSLVNPLFGITESPLISDRLLNAFFGVLHLVDALCTNCCKPTLDGFCFLAGD